MGVRIDGDLLHSVTEDAAGFADLVGRHQAALARYATRRLGPAHAEDIVTGTFAVTHARREPDVDRRPSRPERPLDQRRRNRHGRPLIDRHLRAEGALQFTALLGPVPRAIVAGRVRVGATTRFSTPSAPAGDRVSPLPPPLDADL